MERVPPGQMNSGYNQPQGYNFIENEMVSAPVVEKKPGFNRMNKKVFLRREVKESMDRDKYQQSGNQQKRGQNIGYHANNGYQNNQKKGN
jgi:hypothetical protein